MAETFDRPAMRDDRETEIEVEIEVSSWGCAAQTSGPPESCHDGDPMEFEITGAWLIGYTLDNTAFRGAEVTLTPSEIDRIERDFQENPPEPDYGPDWDLDEP